MKPKTKDQKAAEKWADANLARGTFNYADAYIAFQAGAKYARRQAVMAVKEEFKYEIFAGKRKTPLADADAKRAIAAIRKARR